MTTSDHGFARAVAVLSTGTLLGQLITAASSVVLARLFSPSEIGAMGLYLAFVSVASVCSSLRYESAIPAAKDDREAADLLLASTVLLPITTTAAALVLVLLTLSGLAGYRELPVWSAAAGFAALLLGGLYLALRFWLLRARQMANVARAGVTQSAGRALGQIAGGIAGLSLAGLLLGDLVGRLGGILPGLRSYRAWRAAGPRASTRDVRGTLRRYRRFPLVVLPGSFLNALALVLPLPLLVGFYGIAIGGQFALLQRVVSLPMTVVGSSVADVFHVHISDMRQQDPSHARRTFDRLAVRLAAVALPGAVGLFLFGPVAFSFVFGETWEQAGVMAAMIAPLAAAQFVVGSLSRISLVYGGERAKLLFDGFSLAAVVASLSLAHALGASPIAAVAAYSIMQSVTYALHFVVLRRSLRARGRGKPYPLEEAALDGAL